MSLTAPALNALSEFVDDARTTADRAAGMGLAQTCRRIESLALDLDAARTRLVEDGPDYLDAAWAFLDAGRRILAQYRIQLAQEPARA